MTKMRLLLLVSLVSMTLGFRLLTKATWQINPSDPTIWVKFCDTTWSFQKYGFPEGDTLWGTEPTVPRAVESVINDINSIPSVYVRIASYPPDPDNPPQPQNGDSAFTKLKAQDRTITVCFDKGGPFSGGHARPILTENGKHLRSCEIIIQDSNRYHAATFVSTLGHELGHCLGLDHPQETTHSIMSYFSNEKNFIRYRIDDKMALTHLYRRPRDGEFLGENFTYGMSCDFR